MNPEACKKCEHVSRSLHFCTLDPNNPERLDEMKKPPDGCAHFFRHVVAMGMSDQEPRYEGHILDIMIHTRHTEEPITLREYFQGMLIKLWEEGEFNGKRPYGSSGWRIDVFKALIEARAIKGTLDEDGYVKECDDDAAKQLILKALGEEF